MSSSPPRSRESRSSCRTCNRWLVESPLPTKASAPAARAASSASGRPLSTSTRISGRSKRSKRRSWRPLRPGSSQSSNTRSGGAVIVNLRRRAVASAASPTRSRAASCSTTRRSAERIRGWSSAITTRIGTLMCRRRRRTYNHYSSSAPFPNRPPRRKTAGRTNSLCPGRPARAQCSLRRLFTAAGTGAILTCEISHKWFGSAVICAAAVQKQRHAAWRNGGAGIRRAIDHPARSPSFHTVTRAAAARGHCRLSIRCVA